MIVEDGDLAGPPIFPVGQFADECPVFFSDFFVYRRRTRPVEAVCTIFLWTRNPIVLPGVNIVEVGLESPTAEAPKCFFLVIETSACFRERDKPYASWPHKTSLARGPTRFILDIHDARRRHGFILAHDSIAW
jgi:hypothetical protein